MIGTVLSNRYKLIAELGSGGMAWVYLAKDLLENAKVAVKVLYPQHSQDLGFLQRFVREAKLSMALSQSTPQRHIVSVLDYGADRDTHYLVMEFVQGQDLGQMLSQGGALPWERALDFTRQAALALEHAHQFDIVHRDIKPSNIMVQSDGTVRVLDFGIARARNSPQLTVSGFVGSPHYAAPEQATGRSVDIRADIYSLGVVLYRMLTGILPFQGDTPWAVVNQHLTSEPPPLEERCPDLPQPVIHLVHQAMAKRPDDRFQSPNDMIQAINAVLAGHEIPFEPLPTEKAGAPIALEILYERAKQAAQAERWQEAIDLFSQVLKIDPDYHDVSEQLIRVGQQIRLAKLYRSALRALQSRQWDRALTQLDRISQLAPDYKDIDTLRHEAENKEQAEIDEEAQATEFPTQIPDTPPAHAGSPIAAKARSAAIGSQQPDVHPSRIASAAAPLPRRRGWLWAGILLLAMIVAAGAYAVARAPAATPVAGTEPSATLTTVQTPTASPADTVVSPIAAVDHPTPTHTSSPATATRTPTLSPTPTSTASAVVAPDTPTATQTPTQTPTPIPTTTSGAATGRSPSGVIAFPRFDPARGTYDVYACSVDGSNCRQIATQASQPDFLPDGTRVVVHSWKADEKGIFLLSLSGQRIWQITGQIEAARASVDSKGDTYVYHSRQESDRRPRLYRTYGSENRPIVRQGSAVLGQSPSWLPDQRILYSGCWMDNCGIIVTRDDGTFPRQIVAGTTETNPEASPDGQQVVFMSQRDGNWEVYSANIDGSNLRRLTRDPSNDGLPAWSPDGRYIAFVTNRDGSWVVWVMRPDGSQQRRLFNIGGPLEGPVRDAASHEVHGWLEERISWAP
jgi:serine/threonine protein kinase/Tol biopolymer transport system component